MKGFAHSVSTAAFLGLVTLPQVTVTGQSWMQDPSANQGLVDGEGTKKQQSAATTAVLDGNDPQQRGLGETGYDDALDVQGSPKARAFNALRRRKYWATTEFRASTTTCHANNGDSSSASSFHKTLPHDEYGQVDPDAFEALLECVAEGDFDKCEQVPAGDESGFLIQPIGGNAVDFTGPASSALTAPSAPALNSEEVAANMAELYWMALTRDVPFSKYGENEDTVAAAENLATMPGFAKMTGVAVGMDGKADPQSQLFRSTAVGVETGPMISQLLVKDFTLDSITVTPKMTTFVPGVDYMTDYDEWLHIQNGGSPSVVPAEDSEKRYIRNARDLSRLVVTDTIYTEMFRAALILLGEGAISKAGFNGPYANSTRQKGFVSYGASHVMKILGSAEVAQRSSWFQKWNVHMYARPEAFAGTIHNVILGNIDVDVDASILGNTELLERVASQNAIQNGQTGNPMPTYLLSQATAGGSPSHPSYPAGHAVQNGAYATVLKALVGLERGGSCFSDPVFPDDEGLTLQPYTGDDCLTYEGEINKLAVNIAFGRAMDGVHWRFDSEEGLRLGETIGVRMLQEVNYTHTMLQ
ncbi:unnamed protein product [Laminaria digitata]